MQGVRAAILFFFFSSRRRHTRCSRDWSSDVCSSDLFSQNEVVASGIFEAVLGRSLIWSGASPPAKKTGDRRFCFLIPLCFCGNSLVLRTSVNFPYRPSLLDRKSTRLNSSHGYISYAVFCLQKKKHLRPLFFFFFNDPATTEIYTLPLHDALPILFEAVLGRSLIWSGASPPAKKTGDRRFCFLIPLCFCGNSLVLRTSVNFPYRPSLLRHRSFIPCRVRKGTSFAKEQR